MLVHVKLHSLLYLAFKRKQEQAQLDFDFHDRWSVQQNSFKPGTRRVRFRTFLIPTRNDLDIQIVTNALENLIDLPLSGAERESVSANENQE